MGYEGASSRRRAVVPERDAAPAGLRGSRWRDGLSAVGADDMSTDQPDLPEAVGAGPSDRIRKTIGRWR